MAFILARSGAWVSLEWQSGLRTILRMQKFFEDLSALHRFTLNLDYHRDALQCEKCARAGQFVSHGFLYKAQHQGQMQTVGKRIFCSNRSGRVGCGGTCRLYLAEPVPRLHYTNLHLLVFIHQLIAGCSIRTAYQQATQAEDQRHAYRWLGKLRKKLADYRSWLDCARSHEHSFPTRTRNLQLLLPTLQRLLNLRGDCPCAQVQLQTQQAFL